MSEVVQPHNHCRVCDRALGEPYLDLGEQPLANGLMPPRLTLPGPFGETQILELRRDHEFTAPLEVVLCKNCSLSQLTVVVDPKVLYAGYRFRSGASSQWVQHCEDLAREATEVFKKPGVVIDIACNDGTQLKPFWERGWDTIGVDPAPVPFAFPSRVEATLWDMKVAQMLRHEHRPADLVIAQNVLGHVDDPIGFLAAVEHVLAPDGMLVVEVPHVRDMILSGEFDTIYHEHLNYWSTKAIQWAAREAKLSLHRTENLRHIHGGSRRYWFVRAAEPNIDKHPALQIEMDDIAYRRFGTEVERKLQLVIRKLAEFQAQGKRVWAYGASAKGAVMLNALKARGNVNWPEVILDDVPEKCGLLSPGLHIPILGYVRHEDHTPIPQGDWHPPDILWILSWNWRKQLKAKAREYGFKGKFFLTHPQVGLEN